MSVRRDRLGVRVLECDRCATFMHVSANGDAFDIGRDVTADGWAFGAVDLCRACAQEPAPARPRRGVRAA